MNAIAAASLAVFALCIAFTYGWFFRTDLMRWWRERGPRRQIAREAAAERETELARLRDELAAKYLAGGDKPTDPGA